MEASQAILTKYLPPTNSRGARIKATSASGLSVTIPYEYELSGVDLHAVAVKKLCEKLNWSGELVAGGTDVGYAFVFIVDSFRVGKR